MDDPEADTPPPARPPSTEGGSAAPSWAAVVRSRRGRAVAAGVVVALVAAGAWAVVGRDPGGGDRRDAFEAALADLAGAPALRYTTTGFGGQVRVPYAVTATGQAMASVPPLPGMPGDLTMDSLFVDDKLFVRMDGEIDPAELGFDMSNPAVQDAFENTRDGLGGGEWVTTVSEYDGPIMRNDMAPVGLALRLGDLLARTPDDRIGPAGEDVDGTAALRAETPGGDIYVSAGAPRRVLRFVPAAPPGSEERPGPTLPTIPELPGSPEELPDELREGLPEIPDLPTTAGRPNLRGQRSTRPAGGRQQPPDTAGLGEETQQEDPFASVPMLEGAVERIDLEVLRGDDVTRVYDDLRAWTEELDGAIDGVLEFAEGELTESLDRAIRGGRGVRDCGREACTVEADATLIHGRGSDVPTRLTLAMTVDGRPAGECTATGSVPAEGTGRLGCRNDSDEWTAAYRRGGTVGARVVDVQAMAFTPDDVEAVVQDLQRQSDTAGRGSGHALPEVRTGGVALPGSPAVERDGVSPGVADPLAAILEEIGVSASAWDGLAARVEDDDAPPDERITTADVAALARVVEEMGRLERGTRPLDLIDRDSARRVVERALAARDRAAFIDAIQTLRATYDLVRTSRLAPGRDDSLRAGTRVFLDVADDGVTTGPDGRHTIDLTVLGLDAASGRTLDMLYLRADGTWQAVAVWNDAAAARANPVGTVADIGLLGNVVDELGGNALTWVRNEVGLEHLYLPFDDAHGTVPSEGTDATRSTPVVQDLADGTPRELMADEEFREMFVSQWSNATNAVGLVNGRLPTAVANRPDVRQDVMNAVNQSGRGGTNRRTDGGTHAETDWIASGAADAAFDQALAEGSPTEPAVIRLNVTRSMCGGCTEATIAWWNGRLADLTPQQRASVALEIGARGLYTGGDSPTTVDHLTSLMDAGIAPLALTSPDAGNTRRHHQLAEMIEQARAVAAGDSSITAESVQAGVDSRRLATDQDVEQQRGNQAGWNALQQSTGATPQAPGGTATTRPGGTAPTVTTAPRGTTPGSPTTAPRGTTPGSATTAPRGTTPGSATTAPRGPTRGPGCLTGQSCPRTPTRMNSTAQHNSTLRAYRPAGSPPMAPYVCTCPPCGPTRAPRRRQPAGARRGRNRT